MKSFKNEFLMRNSLILGKQLPIFLPTIIHVKFLREEGASSSPPLNTAYDSAVLRDIVQMARSPDVETKMQAVQQVRYFI